jgi:uncharacterized protein YndB with AHSA1/START domain
MSSVRQQINIAAAPRAVWAKLTTAEGLTEWLADSARADSDEGGRVVLTMEGDDGAPVEERGIFHALRPTRSVEIAFDRAGKGPWAGTRLSVQVARDGDETRVAVVHSGFADDADDALAAIDADWRRALKALRGTLE